MTQQIIAKTLLGKIRQKIQFMRPENSKTRATYINDTPVVL